MGLLNIIRRMHLRQKLSIREIARLTGVSRNTVTKHLAANTIEPKFATPDRQSKIDPLAEKLAGWLKSEAGKSRKERRTVKQLHADLVALGFTGSYAPVAAFARRCRSPGGISCQMHSKLRIIASVTFRFPRGGGSVPALARGRIG